ncbi:hypothetical protein, partial [Pseudaeromonas pectinilytica]
WLMMSLWDALRMNMMISYQELVRTFPKAHLLIKKEPFLKMLGENELDIVWTLLGEKGVIGGSLGSNHHYGRREFSGTFYFDNDKLSGTTRIYSAQ